MENTNPFEKAYVPEIKHGCDNVRLIDILQMIGTRPWHQRGTCDQEI